MVYQFTPQKEYKMTDKPTKKNLTNSFNGQKPSQKEVNDFNFAARRGENDKVEKFLKDYPSAVDAKADNGRTALMVAAANGNQSTVELLLKNNANPLETTLLGRTALKDANREGQREIAAILKKASRDWNKSPKVKQPALQEVNDFNVAARRGDDAAVEKFLQQHPSIIDAEADNGLTALIVAAFNGQKSTVALLLENGADPDKKTAEGRTALKAANREGQTEIAAMLKEASKEIRKSTASKKFQPGR
jgi:ankyrin repeat protein